ncbi:GTP cyclohydrolase 1 [Thalassobaculum fulvum]|uniref:GTP cyclohydrolase 1 n=1 Tax=Thalassobaculum fulvum TaxID=1633335 RepID=A0A919CPA0_9PROT|nr:GTP cyclohydrolase I [Thalassobaculum fulvum]GHD41993.1 GTP cyclohydrolase 1 [Thalassobaculum fulvum]
MNDTDLPKLSGRLPSTLDDGAVDDPRFRAAEDGIRALLAAIGEDPGRDGLRDTPARVVRAFAEYCAGYAQDPVALLRKTFDEVSGYRDLVILTDIDFVSHCEHHLAPIVGRAHIAYLPSKAVVGISKLARVVDAYARRLQIQERMTAQIAGCIEAGLAPSGVGVVVDAEHGCMTLRGVNKRAPRLRTQAFTGRLADDPRLQQRLLDAIPTTW